MTERKLMQLRTEAQEWLRTDHNGFTLDSLVDLILKFAEPRYNCVTEPMEQSFKEVAEDKALENCPIPQDGDWIDIAMNSKYEEGFQDGAVFGYNKANEWHYVKDGDLPEVDNRIVLCVCSDGYIDGKKHYILKLLTRKEFPLFQPVYAWKEIVLPELPKEIE